MPTLRLAPLPVVIAVLLASSAGAVTFDYTTLWTHLADTELDHYIYDCGGVVDLAVKGNFAYAVDSWQGLQVIDWTDPTAIVYRGFLYINRPVGCDVRDHIVYVVTSDGQIAVADVDDHDQPVLVNQVPVGGTPRDVLVLGPWLYVLTGDDTLRIFSLTVASTPTPVGTVSLPAGRSDRMDLDGERLVVAGTGGLAVYNVTTPDWPWLLGTHDLSGAVSGLDVRDGLALVGQVSESRLIDVSDPTAMVELATLDSGGKGALLTSNGQAWLGWGFCWYYGGMNVFDVSTPTAPVLLHQEIQGFRGWPEAMVEY
ncbi:LVIVD repeat-containing protein, partial [Candidatus Eisenbacteria bacterium]